jgi:DNA mismatch endonuclease (patch repair protein)
VRALPAVPASPPASSPAVRAAMQGNRAADTKPELAIRRELHRRGRRFRKHYRLEAGERRCVVDIVFTRARLAVFIDGCRWHCCPEHAREPLTNADYWTAKFARNVARDQANNDALAAGGWHVLRIWEHEDPAEAADRVEAELARLQA